MAVTRTPRFSLPQWSVGTDPYPGRVGFNDIMNLLETQAAVVFPAGPISSRPRSGTFGRFFMANDQGAGGRLYYDGGAGWVEINTNGGGGPGTPVVIGAAGSEGSSDRSARADHSHGLVMATANNHGAMSSQHYALLQGSTMQATAGTVAIRDSGGRLSCAAPNSTVATNVVTVGYLNTRAGSTLNGTWSDVANTPVVRGADATFYVGDPIKPANPTTKRYVDGRVSRRAWKTDVVPLSYGVDELALIPQNWWRYNDDAPASGEGLGPFVEDVAAVMPEFVDAGADGAPEYLKDRDIVWVVAHAAVQVENRRAADEARITALEEQISLLTGMVEDLQRAVSDLHP